MPRTAEKNAGQAPRTGVSVRKKRKKRRSKRYVLHYFLLLAFCFAVAAVMCYAVFFKVERIRVTGVSIYSDSQIIDLTGVMEGDSLFQIPTGMLERKISSKLPYIKKIQIKRSLPATLLIQVEEETPMGAIYTNEGYAIVSTTGKILETKVLSLPEEIPRILGLEGYTFEEGLYAVQQEGKPRDALLPQIVILQELTETMASYGVEFDYIDVSSQFDLYAMYDGRYLINFGTQHKLDEKMNLLMNALDNEDGQFGNMPEEGSIDFNDAITLRAQAVDIIKLKDPRGYFEFSSGEDTSQIGQSGESGEQQTGEPAQDGERQEAQSQETPSGTPSQEGQQEGNPPEQTSETGTPADAAPVPDEEAAPDTGAAPENGSAPPAGTADTADPAPVQPEGETGGGNDVFNGGPLTVVGGDSAGQAERQDSGSQSPQPSSQTQKQEPDEKADEGTAPPAPVTEPDTARNDAAQPESGTTQKNTANDSGDVFNSAGNAPIVNEG